jgi:hypothetical protein
MASAKLRIVNGALVLDLKSANSSFAGSGPFVPLADNEPYRASYSGFISNFVPAATPTDIFAIRCSGARLIRLKSLVLTGTATAASNIIVSLVKRSTLNTGGTPTAVVPVQADTGDDATTATIETYAANPTLGNLIGIMHGSRLNLAPAANGSIDRVAMQYSWLNEKPPLLVAATEQLAINLGGAAWPAGGALDIDFVFTEELAP